MAARGVPEEKLVVLPNGVHTALFQPRERDAALEASLGLRGKTVIGYAGGLVDYEGLDLLLEAVAALKQQRTGPPAWTSTWWWSATATTRRGCTPWPSGCGCWTW